MAAVAVAVMVKFCTPNMPAIHVGTCAVCVTVMRLAPLEVLLPLLSWQGVPHPDTVLEH
jgi:hypothetical protein